MNAAALPEPARRRATLPMTDTKLFALTASYRAVFAELDNLSDIPCSSPMYVTSRDRAAELCEREGILRHRLLTAHTTAEGFRHKVAALLQPVPGCWNGLEDDEARKLLTASVVD